MADNTIEIEIILGKLDQVNRQLGALEDQAEKSGKNIGLKVGAGVAAGLLALEIGKKIFDKIASSLDNAIDSAIEAENAISLLNQSLANSGNFSQAASDSFVQFAKGLQEITKFGDDVIIQNASILASLGNLSGDGLERATKAALDFASTGRVSLEGAFDAIAKAANGNVGALSRYGIKVNENIAPSERFASALDQLEKKFGGLAIAQGATFQGSLDKVKNQIGELAESFGNLVIKSPVVVALFSKLAEGLSKLAGTLDGFGKSGDIVGNIILGLINFSLAITKYVIAPVEYAANSFITAFRAIQFAIQLVISTLGTLSALIIESIAIPIRSALQIIIDGVGIFSESLAAKMQGGIDKIDGKIGEFTNNLKTTSAEKLSEAGATVGDAFANQLNFKFTGAVDGALTSLQTLALNAPALGQQIANGIIPPLVTMNELLERLPTTGESLRAGFNSLFLDMSLKGQAAIDALDKRTQQFKQNVQGAFTTFATGFAQSFAQIGQALVKGQNLFAAFGKAILGVFGQLAVNTGTAIFLMGLGTFNPGQVATGLALITLGGVLQALGGGSSENAAAGAGVGTGVAGGFSSPTPNVGGSEAAALPDQDATRASSKVVVNIQGNVLDRRESGLEIARIIQEQFDLNGSVIAQGATA